MTLFLQFALWGMVEKGMVEKLAGAYDRMRAS
jgi:hypothetical protein